MIDLERELARALRRQEAPAGFAERVLRADRSRRARRRAWLAAASFALVLLPAGWAYQRHQQQQRAEAQLRLALEVASERLNLALQRLNPPTE